MRIPARSVRAEPSVFLVGSVQYSVAEPVAAATALTVIVKAGRALEAWPSLALIDACVAPRLRSGRRARERTVRNTESGPARRMRHRVRKRAAGRVVAEGWKLVAAARGDRGARVPEIVTLSVTAG